MARIARDSTPKRRSARISNTQNQSVRKSSSLPYLDAVEERDETPDIGDEPTLVHTISTPSTRKDLEKRLKELSQLTTPKTEPKVANNLMHPATVHQTTAKAPDSGLKLGFADIHTTGQASLASLQNTPSRRRQSLAHTNISPSFQFKFSHESDMSDQGRQMMDSIREDAAKIKEQMRAEKVLQDQKDAEAEGMFENAAGRRIARPTARAGRFSDVHMAQFKKMDSIANHPSAHRARPGFARPTTQSLKRSSSKADLDEPARPKSSARSPVTRIPPPILGRLASTSPFKSIPPPSSDGQQAPAKRLRHEEDQDVSSSKVSTLPRPVSQRLLSPTKASTARTAEASTTPARSSALPRSNSVKSVRSVPRAIVAPASPIRRDQPQIDKPLPPTPKDTVTSPIKFGLQSATSYKSLAEVAKDPSTSKIPTMANLRSILRSPKKNEAGTPKHATTIPIPASSQKKVDFTPSVKSRYAVKLAESSPSPAKLDRSRVSDKWEPAIPYDSKAFIIDVNNDEEEEEWSEEDIEVAYPTLPALSPRPTSRAGPVDHTFATFQRKAQDFGNRESKEFKSIFTELHPKKPIAHSPSLTLINTTINKTNPTTHVARVLAAPTSPQKLQMHSQSQPHKSPSSIRRVRSSEPVQPFEDKIQTVPHGIPGKKRRMESEATELKFGRDDDAKENRRMTTHIAQIPGAWNDSVLEEDEGEKRGGKRARVYDGGSLVEAVNKGGNNGSPIKKASAARELAAKTAKERKIKASIGGTGVPASASRGVLSLSRLNMLARPKSRG